ncbi:MAG: biotin--[acetyl-CoA-carboxylase] ligase, partial [Bacteroidota bacterium]
MLLPLIVVWVPEKHKTDYIVSIIVPDMTETDRIPYFPEYYEVVPSTNVLAAQFVKDDPPGWTVIWTGFQEEGKGQQGNRWESNSGENLLASWILYPRFLEPRQQFSLSVINSLAIIDLLNEFGVQGRIKWPNDIFTGNKKIAGMLIENSIEGSYLLFSVIGTGLNVNQTVFSK